MICLPSPNNPNPDDPISKSVCCSVCEKQFSFNDLKDIDPYEEKYLCVKCKTKK